MFEKLYICSLVYILMDGKEYKNIMLILLTAALVVLAFLIIRPIIIAVLFGLILAYIFHPLYKKIHKKIKSENVSAFIVVIGILIILLALAIFLIPIIGKQLLAVYMSAQQMDLSEVLQETFPNLFGSTSQDLSASISSFTQDTAAMFLSSVQKIILNFPSMLLQTVVVLFTFFFMLRDHDKMRDYFLSISPFSKEAQRQFYEKFEQVTNSILYGQLIVGITQGIIAGIGYLIFRVPNTALLTIITMLVGIIPVIGPWLVWIPVDIWLFMTGQTGAAIGLLIYGLLIINWIDSIVRPLIVSKMTKMNTAIALIGMIGGLYVFGIIGLILGPLILAYLLLVAEFYKESKFKSILVEEKAMPKPHLPIPNLQRIKK